RREGALTNSSGVMLDTTNPSSYCPTTCSADPIEVSVPVHGGVMEPIDTSHLTGSSRRTFLRLVGLGVPAGLALVACGGPGPTQTGAAGGSGGGKGKAAYWTLSGKPQEDSRKDTIAALN